MQLPSVHVLSLHISPVQVYMSHILLVQSNAIFGETELIKDVLPNCFLFQDSVSFPNAALSCFAAEIDKHMVTNFSGLDLHLSTKGHVFGAFVLHLLGMHRIRTALRNLKIVLLRSEVIYRTFDYNAFGTYAVHVQPISSRHILELMSQQCNIHNLFL